MSTLKATNLQNAGSATTNLTFDTNGNATCGGTLAMSSSFIRNRIINGAMQIWQRGTTGFTSGYAADRWLMNGANVAAQSTDVPSGYQFSHAFSNSSATAAGICQRIESVNTKDLAGATVTVSFWYKRTGAAGNIQVNLDYPTAADNYTSTGNTGATVVSASPSTSWTYYTVTFSALNANVVNGLQVYIVSSNASAASLGGIVTGVQLEPGSIATPFERRSYGQELALCQRYYSQLNPNRPVIATTTNIMIPLSFPVTMRAAPTITSPYVDANYTSSGAPTGVQWNAQIVTISAFTKTGTATITATSFADNIGGAIFMTGATFSGVANWVATGTSIANITASAEL